MATICIVLCTCSNSLQHFIECLTQASKTALLFTVPALPLQEAKAIFEKFDKDGNGTLSFDEFLTELRVNCVFSHKSLYYNSTYSLSGSGHETNVGMEMTSNPSCSFFFTKRAVNEWLPWNASTLLVSRV